MAAASAMCCVAHGSAACRAVCGQAVGPLIHDLGIGIIGVPGLALLPVLAHSTHARTHVPRVERGTVQEKQRRRQRVGGCGRVLVYSCVLPDESRFCFWVLALF